MGIVGAAEHALRRVPVFLSAYRRNRRDKAAYTSSDPSLLRSVARTSRRVILKSASRPTRLLERCWPIQLRHSCHRRPAQSVALRIPHAMISLGGCRRFDAPESPRLGVLFMTGGCARWQ